jgi:predicted RNase H-like HicB family nuclease
VSVPRDYSVLVRWSHEDGAYVAISPEWGPAVSGIGATRAEAVAEFELVLPHLVDIAATDGRAIPSPHVVPS